MQISPLFGLLSLFWEITIGLWNHLAACVLNTNIKIIPNKALLRAIMVYACPPWEYAADSHPLKLQHLHIRVLRAVGKLDRCKPAREYKWLSKFHACMTKN
jgi:hypothetical protein